MERNFDIWLEGYEAYDEGKCWQDSPHFHTDIDKAVAWQYGWEDGEDDAKKA